MSELTADQADRTRFREEFQKRRGYDMLALLPVMTGRIEGSVAASERFLWDIRRTIADLTAENHYDQLTDILKERGMARYSESHESGRAFIADGMDVKRTAAIPMSAMWTQRPGVNHEQFGYNADDRESASVAFPRKADVDQSYKRLSEMLLSGGVYPALATHDPEMIEHVLAFAKRRGIPKDGFEFQMLYGIRRDLQQQLVASGYCLRLYVPYGGAWYPYFMRRLAERPANLLFLARNLCRR